MSCLPRYIGNSIVKSNKGPWVDERKFYNQFISETHHHYAVKLTSTIYYVRNCTYDTSNLRGKNTNESICTLIPSQTWTFRVASMAPLVQNEAYFVAK